MLQEQARKNFDLADLRVLSYIAGVYLMTSVFGFIFLCLTHERWMCLCPIFLPFQTTNYNNCWLPVTVVAI